MGTSLLTSTNMAKNVKPTSEHKGFSKCCLYCPTISLVLAFIFIIVAVGTTGWLAVDVVFPTGTVEYRFGLTKLTVEGPGFSQEYTYPFDKCRDAKEPPIDCDALRDQGLGTLIVACLALLFIVPATFFAFLFLRPAGKQCFAKASMFVTGSRGALRMAALLTALATVSALIGCILFSTIDRDVTYGTTTTGAKITTEAEYFYSFFLFAAATLFLAIATAVLPSSFSLARPPRDASADADFAADAEEIYGDYTYDDMDTTDEKADDRTGPVKPKSKSAGPVSATGSFMSDTSASGTSASASASGSASGSASSGSSGSAS